MKAQCVEAKSRKVLGERGEMRGTMMVVTMCRRGR